MRDLLTRARARMTRSSLKQSSSRGVTYADPLHAGRHPFQTYMLSVAVVSGLPLVFGWAPPRSIEATLPPWLVLIWGVMLFGGSAVALLGSYWLGNYANALTIERIGLLVVGGAACLYGMTLLFVFGLSVAVSAGFVLGFALAALKRSFDIGHIMRTAIKSLKES